MAPVSGKANFPLTAEKLKTAKPVSYNDTNAGRTPNNLRCIAWNPLGTWVATGCTDKTLRVWNVDKPNVRQSTELKGHTGPIERVAFNPVKELELCSVSSDGTARFWDVRSKTLVNEVRGLGEAFTLTWAPDGDFLVVGNKADTLFVLSPTKATPLAAHQQPIQTNHIAFCWSGQRIFAPTGDGKIRILGFPSFEPAYKYDNKARQDTEFSLHGHTSSCISAEMHPFHRYLATGGTDSLIALWDTAEWNCLRTIKKLVGPVRSISFSHDGNYLVAGTDEGSELDIIQTETGELLYSYKTASPCPIVAWAPNRYAIAYGDLGTLRIISVPSK